MNFEFLGALLSGFTTLPQEVIDNETKDDRLLFLVVFGEVCKPYNWICHGLLFNSEGEGLQPPWSNLKKQVKK